MLDAVLRAGELEGVSAEEFAAVYGFPNERCGRSDVAGRGEVDPVVGEHGVHAVRDGLQESPQEVARDPRGGPLVQLDEGKLRGTVDSHEKMELALLGPDLGDVDVEEADGVGLEALADGLVAAGLGQP